MTIGFEYRHTYPIFLRSIGGLVALSFAVFLLDWATGANFMYLGQNNPLAIPFLPKSFTTWPWSYPSFVGVGLIMLHMVYFGMKALEKRYTLSALNNKRATRLKAA